VPAKGERHFTPDGVSTLGAIVTINIALLTEGYAVAGDLRLL
jgi:hypothetical protein